ncbi:response regulator [cf. Phormidesmis sp. LEGE 11477]|uniref:response regulator n=1 Tax=cf. Phormidesmis sp. LEGE 11477 TaxID=1828680 RepID=UPI00187F9C34|nr:response regulator [cf. Phormidesmis sp. LEGE 11477]MBE9063712.1 response regulator [cf. Phormidesmis sp. LEGE 11477]
MNFRDHSILMVEDDSNDIFFIQRAFRQVNKTNPIRVVKDGEAAIDYLSGAGEYSDREQYPLPTLILLDLKLPRRSGTEVLKWLRQQPVIKRLPVVILTSSRENVDVNTTYELGISSYLVKPVSFDALSSMIATLNTYWLKLNEYPSVTLT